jgi:hypothetical protein
VVVKFYWWTHLSIKSLLRYSQWRLSF